MDHSALFAYSGALAALTAAPGPVVAVLVARSLGRDSTGAAAFAAGLCLGDVLAVCIVALGVGVWAEGRPDLFSAAKYLGVAYLIWLSVRMWNDASGLAAGEERRTGWLASACAGVALCLGNPSTLLIYILLLPTVAPAGIADLPQLALLVLVTFVSVGAVFFGTIVLARQVDRLFASPRASSRFSRISAALIALTSIWVLAS
jgi:threonine/homoserine/homoserine lactone efflux protein